jgi:hypothetical protein
MKFSLGTLLVPVLAGCVFAPSATKETFESAPSSIDERIETASIEDYIIALPPFAYHEESVNQFVDKVRRAREESKENRGKGANHLYVNGDGCWPAKDFVLDRDRRTLKVRVYNWEPGMTDYTETMRRVPGGWMRGPHVEIKTAEQAGRGDSDKPPN